MTLQLASFALSLESRVRLGHSSPPEDSASAGKSGPSGFARTVLGQRNNNNTLVARARVQHSTEVGGEYLARAGGRVSTGFCRV